MNNSEIATAKLTHSYVDAASYEARTLASRDGVGGQVNVRGSNLVIAGSKEGNRQVITVAFNFNEDPLPWPTGEERQVDSKG